MRKPYIVGVLCYGLVPATVDLLNRLADRLSKDKVQLKAFPLVKKDIRTSTINFTYRPPSFQGRYWVIKNKVPDRQLLTVQFLTITNLIRESDVIVLLGIQSIPAIVAAVWGRSLAKPILAITQMVPPAMERLRPWYIRLAKRFVLKLSQLYIVQTEATRQTLKEVYGIHDKYMIYAPFDGGGKLFKELVEQRSPIDKNKIRAQFSVPPDALVFVFVGTLLYLKGVDILLDAFAKLSSSLHNSYLWIVGPDGGQFNLLCRQAERLGVSERVIFIGEKPLEELIEIYAASDVLVLPTRKDVWPKVLVEAALMGLPLITTTATGAANSLVKDGLSGFVVPVNDTDALANAMLRLSDAKIRAKMGLHSREIVEKFIQPELEADQIYRTILRLLKTRS